MDPIVLRDVVKRFRKSTIRQGHTTFKSEFLRWMRGTKQLDDGAYIDVLRGVNLTIRKGETFGLLGRNGTGKSTMLKLVTSIYKPTSGTVEVRGRVSALLELGAGFHPDFSGRENILVNGIILGMSRREIRARMDEIIAFSELENYIDEPVRTYSSGMYMRLAFSIATHVDPEILIIDEILAVGDAHFSRKSFARMEEFRRNGKTILLVTHDLSTIERWCDRAGWLDGGTLRAEGNPVEVVKAYRDEVARQERTFSGKPVMSPSGSTEAGDLVVEEIELIKPGQNGSDEVRKGYSAVIRLRAPAPIADAQLRISLGRAIGATLWVADLPGEKQGLTLPEGLSTLSVTLPELPLSRGEYALVVTPVPVEQGGWTGRLLGRCRLEFWEDRPGDGLLAPPPLAWTLDSHTSSSPLET